MITPAISVLSEPPSCVSSPSAGKVVFDGEPAAAFGVAGSAGATFLLAQHAIGPDAAGVATMLIDARLLRVRYRHGAAGIAVGDTVMLRADEAIVERIP